MMQNEVSKDEEVQVQPESNDRAVTDETAVDPNEPERQDVTTLHERTIATLSYFGFFAIVPFYLKKDSEFCRFHGKQGMLVALVFFMMKLLSVLDLLMDIMLIIQVAIMFWMGLAALSGRWKKIPFFYDWACQLEQALTLKTKEEELDEVGLKPESVNAEPNGSENK